MNILPDKTIYQISDDMRETGGLYVVMAPHFDEHGDSWDVVRITKNSLRIRDIQYEIIGKFWELEHAVTMLKALEYEKQKDMEDSSFERKYSANGNDTHERSGGHDDNTNK